MNNNQLNELDVVELRKLIYQRKISSSELVRSCLNQIEAAQSSTNAFVTFNAEWALEQAQAFDTQAANGQFAGPLHGIPVAVKDNYWTADFPTTACSQVHQGKPNGMDATVVAKLRGAGAIVIGKTNMHEWAYGATNEVSSCGPTRNPWNNDHITGGSSGGSGSGVGSKDGSCCSGKRHGGVSPNSGSCMWCVWAENNLWACQPSWHSSFIMVSRHQWPNGTICPGSWPSFQNYFRRGP